MRHRTALVTLLAICYAFLLPAATKAVPAPVVNPPSTLVKNINTATRNDSLPAFFAYNTTAIGNRAYFVDYDRNNGYELWTTDGTGAGTHLLRDLNPGRADSQPSNLVDAGGTLFFVAGDLTTGRWLWKSDGSTAGTLPVVDPQTGEPLRGGNELYPVGSSIYFRSATSSGSNTLWKSDGTASGTVLLHSWASYIQIGGFAEVNGSLFFFGLPSNGSLELWQSNGSIAGTQLIKVVGTNIFSLPDQVAAVGNQFYALIGYALWRSDGTPTGTQQILTLNGIASEFTSYGGMLYYRGTFDIIPPGPQPQPEQHTGLLRLANSSTTPEVVYDFGKGALSSPSSMRNVGGKLYFLAGFEIWASNGITTGAVLGADGLPIKDPRGSYGIKPRMAALNDGTVILSATRDPNAFPTLYDLWAINGTTGVAQRVRVFGIGEGAEPIAFASLGGTMLFAAGTSGQNGNRAIWRTDGTEQGTIALTSRIIEQGIDGPFPGSQALEQVAINGHMLFTTVQDSSYELWSSDGSSDGTIPVFNTMIPGGITSLVDWNGAGYFLAPTTTGYGLWRTDGTVSGTIVLTSVAAPVSVYGLVHTPQSLYFITATRSAIVNGYGDISLWKSDGTAAGTMPVVSLPSYRSFSDSGYPFPPEVTGNRLFFIASEAATGRELWVSDGTQAGTHITKDIGLGINSPNLIGLTAVGNRLFFLEGFSTVSGYNLWVSDGTEAGTTIAKALGPVPQGPSSTVNGQTIDLNGRAFFSGWDTQAWIEPWISDGTEAGTQRIKDINQTPSFMGPQLTGASLPYDMVTLNGKALFAANDGIHGNELWISDGTEAGTTLVLDLNPGPIGSAPNALASFGNIAIFAASSGPDGVELWKTDGTAAGTTRLADVAPGPASSNPTGFRLVGPTLFFLADDGTTGRELHALNLFTLSYRVFLPGVVHS